MLTGVTDSMRVWREEIFGPVAPIATFGGYGEEGERTALKLANDTEYGLAAYVYTSNHPRFTRMAAGLEFGLIGYNSGVISNAAAPFGGVKQSGMGREGGPRVWRSTPSCSTSARRTRSPDRRAAVGLVVAISGV